MQTSSADKHLQLSTVFTDRLLDAVHEIIPNEAKHDDAGKKNGRQFFILLVLLRAAAATACGIAENAQEEKSPMVSGVARDLKQLTAVITTAITAATNSQHDETWGNPINVQNFSMPSMSNKELV